MKTMAEYKRDERERKRKSGKKRVGFWIDPVNEARIKSYVYQLEEDVRIIKSNH